MASEAAREIARRALYTLSPSAWCRRELKLALDPWQIRMVDAPAASRVIALTFRQAGKTSAAAVGVAHTMLSLRLVVGEDNKFAGPREGPGATGADRKGSRIGLVPELARELEPSCARRARRKLQSVKKEVAIAVGTTADKAGAPLAGRRKGPGFAGRDGPDGDFPLPRRDSNLLPGF